MESDSRRLSDSCQYSAIYTAYHTSLHSITICPVRIQMYSINRAQQWDLPESNSQLGLSLDTTEYVQTNRDCASRATTTLTTHQHQACSSNREKPAKTPRRVSKREGTTSSMWVDRQTWLHFSICAHHPNILPTLSQDCHITQQFTVVGVDMVVIGCSSQQIRKKELMVSTRMILRQQ